MHLAFCSSCNHSEPYGSSNTRTIPKPNFCPKCGEKMLFGCKKCNSERRSMDDKFCTVCGASYK